ESQRTGPRRPSSRVVESERVVESSTGLRLSAQSRSFVSPSDTSLESPENRVNRRSGIETLCGAERATNNRRVDRVTVPQTPANLTQRQSLAVQRQYIGDVHLILLRASTVDTSGLRTSNAREHTLSDQASLKLSNRAEHSEQQPSSRCGGIHGLLSCHEVHAQGLQLTGHRQKVMCGSRQAVQA